jgi:ABC-type proline/glycine betaine transport system permease subunit
MSVAFILLGWTTFGPVRSLLLIVVFGFMAWRIRRNMIIVFGSLIVILVSSGSLFRNSWENASRPLAALGASIFIFALIGLVIAISRTFSGAGKKSVRGPRPARRQ